MRTGDWYFESTLQKNLWPGIPPSRANAYIMRLLDVMENVPQKNIAPMTMTCSVSARHNISDSKYGPSGRWHPSLVLYLGISVPRARRLLS